MWSIFTYINILYRKFNARSDLYSVVYTEFRQLIQYKGLGAKRKLKVINNENGKFVQEN